MLSGRGSTRNFPFRNLMLTMLRIGSRPHGALPSKYSSRSHNFETYCILTLYSMKNPEFGLRRVFKIVKIFPLYNEGISQIALAGESF